MIQNNIQKTGLETRSSTEKPIGETSRSVLYTPKNRVLRVDSVTPFNLSSRSSCVSYTRSQVQVITVAPHVHTRSSVAPRMGQKMKKRRFDGQTCLAATSSLLGARVILMIKYGPPIHVTIHKHNVLEENKSSYFSSLFDDYFNRREMHESLGTGVFLRYRSIVILSADGILCAYAA